ncbi:hypothetical protein DTO217A2_2773 [Paecilomyces variotii]|nr:hypothetical protein DTO217A2_2773 [Paecilomyces variotii]
MTQVSVNFESHISFRIIIENRRSPIVFWNAGNSIVVETCENHGVVRKNASSRIIMIIWGAWGWKKEGSNSEKARRRNNTPEAQVLLQTGSTTVH